MNRINQKCSCLPLHGNWTPGFAVRVAVLLFTAGCAPKPYHAIDLRGAIAHGDPVRVTMKDGRIFRLDKPVVVNDSLRGTVVAKPPSDLAVPVSDVLRVERMQAVGPRKALVLVVASVLGIILVQEAWEQ